MYFQGRKLRQMSLGPVLHRQTYLAPHRAQRQVHFSLTQLNQHLGHLFNSKHRHFKVLPSPDLRRSVVPILHLEVNSRHLALLQVQTQCLVNRRLSGRLQRLLPAFLATPMPPLRARITSSARQMPLLRLLPCRRVKIPWTLPLRPTLEFSEVNKRHSLQRQAHLLPLRVRHFHPLRFLNHPRLSAWAKQTLSYPVQLQQPLNSCQATIIRPHSGHQLTPQLPRNSPRRLQEPLQRSTLIHSALALPRQTHRHSESTVHLSVQTMHLSQTFLELQLSRRKMPLMIVFIQQTINLRTTRRACSSPNNLSWDQYRSNHRPRI